MRNLLILLAAILIAAPFAAAQGTITTVAGGGPNNLPATSANLSAPVGLTRDTAGNIYVSTNGQHRIFKIDTSGNLTVYAGNGAPGYSGDSGLATSASLNQPRTMAFDAAGNLYVAELQNHTVRRIDAITRIITTVAGTGVQGYNGDNIPATSALLNSPHGLAFDSAGNLFIAQYYPGCRIRRVDHLTGIITTIAGNGSCSTSGDGGRATAAMMLDATGLLFDADGSLLFAEANAGRVRRIVPGGDGIITGAADEIISTIASGLNFPLGLARDTTGDYLVTDYGGRIYRINHVTLAKNSVIGSGVSGFSGDGLQASLARFNAIFDILLDAAGNLLITDVNNNRVRKVVPGADGIITGAFDETISTGSGNGLTTFSGDGFAATSASLNFSFSISYDPAGNLYISDTENQRVRRVDAATGIISTIVGTGVQGFGGDGGLATAARVSQPLSATMDSAGNLYFADYDNQRIRRVDKVTGIITTVAGGCAGYNGDGIAATSACLYYPYGVAFDTHGNLFIAEQQNHRVRRVDAITGKISTVAGNGCSGYNGDGISATSACLTSPLVVAVDGVGNLFISDSNDNRIRRVDHTTGQISTVAGTGAAGYNGDNILATSASLNNPFQLALDGTGNLYFADTNNQRVRRVDGVTHIITTVAGTGAYGFSGDGVSPTSASLAYPKGFALDGAGNMVFIDAGNSRVRRVTLDSTAPIITPTIVGTLGDNGWYVSDVTLSWNVTDAESTVSTMTGCGSSSVTTDTLGTTFTCTATSAGGTASNAVTINRDTTVPHLSLSADLTVAATGPSGAVVNFIVTANDDLAGALTPSCTPASGSTFAIGLTTVNCLARDPAGNVSTGSSSVTVSRLSQQINFAALSNRTYGNADFGASATASSGLTVSFTVGLADSCTISGNMVHITGAGSCTVTAHQAGDSNYTAASDVPQTFAINRATASVTPTAAGKTYGMLDPALTGTLSGFLAADGVTASYSRTTGETVTNGPYTISATLNPASVLSNYSITYNTASFTINKATLTISAISTTKILNAPNPSLNNATYSGFAFSDGPGSLSGTLNCTTTAGTTSPVGTYPITCSGSTSTNYAISYVPGTLKVLYATAGLTCAGDVGRTVLQPINADGSSVWKQGRTIPVKFKVCDANGASVGTPGVVSSFNLTGIWSGTLDAVDETVAATNSDTSFRWDGQEWIFNLSTSNLSANKTYIYTILLNDGTIISGTTLAGLDQASFQYGLR